MHTHTHTYMSTAACTHTHTHTHTHTLMHVRIHTTTHAQKLSFAEQQHKTKVHVEGAHTHARTQMRVHIHIQPISFAHQTAQNKSRRSKHGIPNYTHSNVSSVQNMDSLFRLTVRCLDVLNGSINHGWPLQDHIGVLVTQAHTLNIEQLYLSTKTWQFVYGVALC
jgi:hypothetical protein